MAESLSFSAVFFALLLMAACQQCPYYTENCLNCTAEVSASGKLVALSQCQSCPSSSLAHTTLAANRSQGCVACHYSCKACSTQYQGSCQPGQCEIEYYESSGYCLRCPIAHCQSCNSAVCLACLDGYYLSSDATVCIGCGVYPFALTCRENTIVSCQAGYYVVNGEVCQPCLANCSSCTSNATCAVCFDGFYGSNCTSCGGGCLRCRSLTMCLACQTTHYLSASYACERCTDANCQKCAQNGSCSQCQPNHYLNGSMGCFPATSSILNCQLYNSSTSCQNCSSGYYLFHQECRPCSILCSTCWGPNFGNCYSCRSNARLYNNQCLANLTIGSSDVATQQYLTGRNNPNRIASDLPNKYLMVCTDAVIVGQRLTVSVNDISSYGITLQWKVYLLGSSATYSVMWSTNTSSPLNTTYNSSSVASALCSTTSTNYIVVASANYSSLGLNNTFAMGATQSQQIALSELLMVFATCPDSTCRLCSSKNNCTLCYDGLSYKQLGSCVVACSSQFYTFLEERQCYSKCPIGTYPDDLAVSCVKCVSPCLRCSSPINCSLCATTYYLLNNACVSTCSVGYYPNPQTGRCESCVYPCSTCSNASYCLSCTTNFLSEGNCYSTCPSTSYSDLIQMKCISCSTASYNCKECLSGEKCLSCVPGFSLYNSSCLVGCPDGFYGNGTDCLPCGVRCLTCSSNSANCTACSIGFLAGNACLNNCPDGTYAQLSSMSCQNCSAPCSTCLNSSSSCTACTGSSRLFSNRCYSQCPDGTYPVNTGCVPCVYPCLFCSGASTCLSCRQGYLNNHSCVYAEQCQPGTYANITTQTCQPCGSSCLTCQLSPERCTSCDTTHTLDYLNNRCVLVCPTGLFNALQERCQACSTICLTCSVVSYNCTSCTSSTILQNGTCVSNCTEGYYYSGTVCVRCDSKCAVCSGPMNCQACSAGYFMNASLANSMPCVSLCQDGFYGDSTARMCIGCSPPCRTCSSSLQCSTCLSGWLFGSSCVVNCPTGTFSNQSTGQCMPCATDCLTCSITAQRCTSCPAGLLLSSHSCITSCQDGQYFDSASSSCFICQSPCRTCVQSAIKCLSCLSNFLTEVSTCQQTCPQGSFPNTPTVTCEKCISPCLYCQSPTQCTTCINQYYLESNLTCVSTCKNGEYGSNGLCLACPFPCLTCSTSTICSSCQVGNLNNGSCSNQCDAGSYRQYSPALNSYLCQRCASECQLCVNAATFCVLCSNSSFFSLNGSCYSRCPDGFFGSNSTRTCMACQGDCVSCLSSTHCLRCESQFLLKSTCVNCNSLTNTVCPSGYYEDPQLLECVACVAPCVTCTSTTVCRSCQQPLFLYQYACLSVCPNTTYPYLLNKTCVACSFPCQSCTGPSVCSSCLSGYLFYSQNGTGSCIEGPLCPNSLYLNQQTMQCIDQVYCPANFFRWAAGRSCGRQCPTSLLGFTANMSCLQRCPAEYYLTTSSTCEPATNLTDFPQAALSYHIIKSQLYGKISFQKPVRWLKAVSGSWIILTMSGPYPLKRLLYQTTISVTNIQQTTTSVSFQVPVQSTLNSTTISMMLANDFLTSIADNSSGLLLQQPSFSTAIEYFQPYSADYIGMGFQHIGEVLCGAVYILALGFLFSNKLCQLYTLIDLLQQLYLLSFLAVQYPPNLAELLAGFANSHLRFLPNIFSLLFDGVYREYSPLKFYELSYDINFLRNAGHVYTLLLLLVVGYLGLLLTKFILHKLKGKYPSLPSYLPTVERQLSLVSGSYLTDILLTLTSVTLFFAFAQMSDYQATSLSRASAAFSLVTSIAFAAYFSRLVKSMKLLRKQQQLSPATYGRFVRLRPDLDCFNQSIHPNSPFGCYLVLVLVTKKLFSCIAFGLLYNRPLFALAFLGGVEIAFSVLILYYKPFFNLSYNYTVAGASLCMLLLYLLVGIMQFNYDSIDWYSKWVMGWFGCVLAIVAGFGQFFCVAYRIVTGGYQRKQLHAESDEQNASRLDEDYQPTKYQLKRPKSKQIKKIMAFPLGDCSQLPLQPAKGHLITYDPSDTNPEQPPKLLMQCSRYPMPR